MNKCEILHELNEILYICFENIDISKFVITGKAANVLCNNTDDPTMNSIDIWVDKKYYDIISNEGEYSEFNDKEVPYIALGYVTILTDGMVKLYRGKLPKPRCRKINGFNVQTLNLDKETYKRKRDNLRVIK